MAREFSMGFFGVSRFAHIRSSLSLEIWSTFPPSSYPRGKLKGAQCSEPVKSKKNNIIKSRFSSCQEEKQLGSRDRSGCCYSTELKDISLLSNRNVFKSMVH